jgi:glycosyltransferase involved in cell wall biosynthesis
MDLSVVITTYNRKEKLLECIASIKKADFSGIAWELIVIDDNSSDGTEKIAAKDFPIANSQIIHNERNQLMVKSRNIGAQAAQGKYVVFVDDDNIVDEKMFKALFDFVEKNAEYGILGPAMYWWHDKQKYLNFQEINFFTGRTYGRVENSSKKVFDSDGIPNVFLIKKVVFEKAGYFDEKLLNDYTEPDFAFNARKFGFKCGMIPEAKTYHNIAQKDLHGTRTLAGQFNEKAYYLTRNRIIIIVRYGTWQHKLVFMLIFSWFWPLIYSFLMLKAKRADLMGLYWKGFWDGWRYFFTGKIG